MTTVKEDSYFASEMQSYIETTASNGALENAIDWIAKNLNPDDVFSDDQLDSWAKNKGYEKN